MGTSGMDRWYRHGKALLDGISASRPQPGEAHIWFGGQHGFIISLGGLVIYIDLILNGLFDGAGKNLRVYPPPFGPGEPQRVDYVLCTHNHADHLNLETLLPLAKANPGARFAVPAPWKSILTGAGIAESRVLAARAGEETRLMPESGPGNGVTLIPVPAVHTAYIQDEGRKDGHGDYTALGFVLKGEGLSLYHPGDTWVTPRLVKTLKALGPFDVAMLPINGTDWERTAENCIGNISYLDAVKLARGIPIDLVIPSHYDMMAFNSVNPACFAGSMYTLCPEKRFHVCALGERFIYRKEAPLL